jgi:hypothetical protein
MQINFKLGHQPIQFRLKGVKTGQYRGGSWLVDDRINWLKMLVKGFQVAYGASDEIEIKKKEAAN